MLAQLAYAYAKDIGMNAKLVDLSDYKMPLYDGDFEKENGIPEEAQALKNLFISSRGFFISTPEYNGFFPPILKNAIDWMSRSSNKNEAQLSAFKGKISVISAVSMGKLGGIRALPFLRLLLTNVGVNVLPEQVAIPNAFENFDENGNLLDENLKIALHHSINSLNGVYSYNNPK